MAHDQDAEDLGPLPGAVLMRPISTWVILAALAAVIWLTWETPET